MLGSRVKWHGYRSQRNGMDALEHCGGTLRTCRKSICLDTPKRPMIFVNVNLLGGRPFRSMRRGAGHSKPTGAPRSRISSTTIPWRPLSARSWPTGRNGPEPHLTFCRPASMLPGMPWLGTGLAGQRVPAHSLAGCAGHRRSSAHSELKLRSAARGGWECGQSGSRPRVRTDSITSSAPSAASAAMETERV
jgi:hypothetical protein